MIVGNHSDPGLLARFDASAAAAPGRPAVIAADGAFTFGELRDAVDGVAALLGSKGVGRGSRVGLALSRSRWLVAALLGAWRRGAAYVPLDPAYPEHRLVHLVTHARVDVVLTDRSVQDVVPAAPSGSGAQRSDPADPAYVIHTSGSTGAPKGVEVTRGAVDRLVAALEEAGVYPAAPGTVAWNASASFDASVKQWVRVCRGDTVVVLSDEQRVDGELLERALRDHAVTDLDVTPSHWAAVGPSVLRGRSGQSGQAPLRLYMGGESVPAAMWSDLVAARPAVRAYNLYGPTECTVDATATEVSGPTPHIGRPLPGTRAHVLDGRLRPVGVGTPGELYLSGPGLARGYVDRPDLTAERFVADGRAGDGSRMYRTGDRVRWTGDGTLEYLGREDDQVKVGGHRIEPGEITAVLDRHPAVARSVVFVHRAGAQPRLVACYVGSSGAGEPGVDGALRDHLAGELPAHMVPAVIRRVEPLPVTAHGKVDVAALAAIVTAGDTDGPTTGPTTEPTDDGALDEVDRRLIAIVGTTLGIPCGLDDDFFELGGGSLDALDVLARIRDELGVRVRLRDFYRSDSLRAVRQLIGAVA
jgi:amino acid adenylation domain-containing protein